MLSSQESLPKGAAARAVGMAATLSSTADKGKASFDHNVTSTLVRVIVIGPDD
jgi:hypothetical protein